MPIYIPVYLSIYISTYLSLHLSSYLFIFFIYLSVYQLFLNLSSYLSVYLSTCLSSVAASYLYFVSMIAFLKSEYIFLHLTNLFITFLPMTFHKPVFRGISALFQFKHARHKFNKSIDY